MNRFLVLGALLASLVVSSWFAGGSVGGSSACDNGQCFVSASSSLASILISIALVVLLIFYRQRSGVLNESAVVGVWRRFAAFFLDFMLVVLVVASLGAIPPLIAEAHFTGEFHWAFERRFSRPTDSVLFLPGALGGFLLLFLYFYWHPRVGRQTVGQYVLGYRVLAAEAAKPKYGLRALLAFIGLCVWPVSVILALLTPGKVFWWDKATNSRVVRVGS